MPIQFITPSIISSVANTQVTGTITASQIATVNANTITSGTIPTTQLPRIPSANMPVGSILQVVRNGAVFPTTTFSSTSYVDSGASVTITPSNANSRIMLLFRSPRQSYAGGAVGRYQFYRNTTGIGTDPQTQNDLSGERFGSSFSMFFIDSPNTTSSITFRVYAKTSSGGGNFSWAGDDPYEFIAMEIAA
jgi:hypothetical protein